MSTTDPLASIERTVDCSSTGGYANTAARLAAFIAALADAKFKDYIITEPGDTLDGNFTLKQPATSALGATSGYVVIRPRGFDAAVPIGQRATEADTASMTTLRSVASSSGAGFCDPVIICPETGTEYYWLSGLHIIPKDDTRCTSSLVSLSPSSDGSDPDKQADHMMVDRCCILGDTTGANGGPGTIRGILFCGQYVGCIHSTIDDIKTLNNESDCQAISMAFGAGPVLIDNNLLGATAENVLFETPTGESIVHSPGGSGVSVTYNTGTPNTVTIAVSKPSYDCIGKVFNFAATPAATATITALTGTGPWTLELSGALSGVANGTTGSAYIQYNHAASYFPGDITITRNYFRKKQSWNPNDASFERASGIYNVKNFLEFKSGSRTLVEGNIFDGSWAGGGQNYALTLTPRYSNCPVGDLTFKNNKMMNCFAIASIAASDSNDGGEVPGPYLQNHRITIYNNLLDNIITDNVGIYGAAGADEYAIQWRIYDVTDTVNGVVGGPTTMDDFVYEHNTHVGQVDGANFVMGNGNDPAGFTKAERLIIRNNVMTTNVNGPFTSAYNSTNGTTCLNQVSNSATRIVTKNIFFDTAYNGSDFTTDTGNVVVTTANRSTIGFTDFAGRDYSIASGTYDNWGSDGTDPGCNFATLNAAIAGAITGVWPARLYLPIRWP